MPTRKSREDREKKEKKESTIYVIDEATLAQMEEPQSAPVTNINNNRPRKLNLQVLILFVYLFIFFFINFVCLFGNYYFLV